MNKCGLHCTKIENISVNIENEEIIKNVSFDIYCKEITMIIGKNGAGKSTLLKALLDEIDHTGKVEFYDEKNKKVKDLNNYKYLDNYLKNNCAVDCKYFVLKRRNNESKNK